MYSGHMGDDESSPRISELLKIRVSWVRFWRAAGRMGGAWDSGGWGGAL
jgi:hypothetical protein